MIGIVFWLLVWQLVSMAVGEELLLASPLIVVRTLIVLVRQGSFWSTIIFSCVRIISGFLMALLCGVLLAALSARFTLAQTLIAPLMSLMKSIPVASFVIIILFWFGSRNLSMIIAFIMVMPVIYHNTLQGIQNVDIKLLEMTSIFRVGMFRKLIFVYLPEVMPFFIAGCKVALGLCWKSGIAAELIGIPSGSIGERLYQAKIFLSTGEVFAWTAVIILLSVLFEKAFLHLLFMGQSKLEKSV